MPVPTIDILIIAEAGAYLLETDCGMNTHNQSGMIRDVIKLCEDLREQLDDPIYQFAGSRAKRSAIEARNHEIKKLLDKIGELENKVQELERQRND